jgi:tRNA(adenine34) deaminase
LQISSQIQDILWMMDEALLEAEKAYWEDEVPIGAIITNADGVIIARTHNKKEKVNNPCGHAEILSIIEAAKKIENWRLVDCSLFVTLEPCPMCMGAIVQARIKNLYFGAYDGKGGAISLNFNLHNNNKLNHKFNVFGGLKHFECSKILSKFFREKRSGYNNY